VENPRYGGRDDHEGHNLSLEEPGPKAFEITMHDAHFLKRFWAPSNVIKYDGKTDPSVWLEDYQLACQVGGVDDDFFIIRFLSI
jgi:hypothetical protein